MTVRPILPGAALAVALSAGLATYLSADDARPPAASSASPRWRQHDVERPHPPAVAPADNPSAPPKDAVVLFDGTKLDAWQSSGGAAAKWRVVDGAMETVPGAGMIQTRRQFGDIQLHLEWAAPSPPHGKGQDRGNSGLFLLGQYEVQILDSYQADTYADGQAGAIYGQFPPLANAARPPGAWQTYDIAFRRPRFDPSGQVIDPARITVWHNGILVQNNEEPFGPTMWLKWLDPEKNRDRGPLALQDHDHPVRFRNIWVRELPERALPPAGRVAGDAPASTVKLPADALDRLAGEYRMGNQPGAAKVRFAREGDHLTVAFPFRPVALAILPTSPTEFAMPYTDGTFTFRVDDKGRATAVHFRIGDGGRDMERVGP